MLQKCFSLTNLHTFCSQDTGLLYDNYLKQVLKVLESNSELRKKMEEASVDDIKVGGQMPNLKFSTKSYSLN